MPYWRLYYHLVWATRGREAILVDDLEPAVRRVIHQVGAEMGVAVLAVGNATDHIHVVASIPPSKAIADVVKMMKGRSTYAANHDPAGRRTANFGWQSEYGVLSFGEQALPKVMAYVENQRDRHARNDIWLKLEHDSSEQPPTAHVISPGGTSPS